MTNAKTVFIELDGGSWNVINPLIRQGRLPHLERLIRGGAAGSLASMPPFVSPKLWTTIFSGKKPEKHNIYFFGASSQEVMCKRIWDIFTEAGLKVGIFGSLVTWPPQQLDGFVIPSLFALGTETYPADYEFIQQLLLSEKRKSKLSSATTLALKDMLHYTFKLLSSGLTPGTLRKILGYLLCEKISRLAPKDAYWRKALIYLDMCGDLFLNLYGLYRPDFSTFHIHTCDSLSHKYWKYYEPHLFTGVPADEAKKYGNVIPMSYVCADNFIGKILPKIDNNTTVIVASDHGFEACFGISENLYDLNIDALVNTLGISDRVIPAHIGFNTYLYFKNMELMHEIAKLIEGIVFQDTGERVFQSKIMEGYIGLRVPFKSWETPARDTSVICIGDSVTCDFCELFAHSAKDRITGNHREEGVIIMNGPCIEPGSTIENASILDVTPTILATMGYPVAKDMDGRTLSEAFNDAFLRTNPVDYIDTYEDPEPKEKTLTDTDYDKIKERLRGLGYL